jgi:hypothetical protein
MVPYLSFLLFFSFPSTAISSTPIQDSYLEECEEESLETEDDLTQDANNLNEEEELLALPKKGNRPQVIQIPIKTSSSKKTKTSKLGEKKP